MQILTSHGALTPLKSDCLIIGVSEKLHLTTTDLDAPCHALIKETVKLGDFTGKIGESIMLTKPTGVTSKRLLLVGTGQVETVSTLEFRKILNTAFRVLLRTKTSHAMTTLHLLPVNTHSAKWCLQETVLALFDNLYQFETYKSTPAAPYGLTKLSLHLTDKKLATQTKDLLAQATHIAAGVTFTKNLANTPPNICTPNYLANQAQQLAKDYNTLSTEIIDDQQAKKLGMGAFYSVAQGSDNPGKIIIIKYKGTSKTKIQPIVLVGKGITFDTGGYCIKPPAAMGDMKYDMCGAATVLGVMKICAELKLPIPIIGVVVAAENMISGRASRLSDIVTSLSGQTIEITNTDAEGRLVLCDALTYISKYNPSKVISIATLTGAAIIALGFETTALMANNQQLADELLAAGNHAEDRAWQLPLHEEYHDYMKSEFADMVNASFSRAAGSITAGCFLSNFTKDYHWAHLDIAGTSLITGKQSKASGRPVPLLIDYLLTQAQNG